MLCNRCQAWELDQSDMYCGWCGLELLGLERSPGGDPLHVYLQVPLPASVALPILFKNYGHVAAAIEVVETSSWISVEGLSQDGIAPSEKAELTVVIDPSLLDCPADGKLTYRILPSGTEQTVRIAVFEQPELQALPLNAFRGVQSIVPFQLDFLEAPIVIEGIDFDPPLLALHSASPIPLRIGEGEFEVMVNVPEHESAKQLLVTARFRVQGIAEPLEVQCELTIEPPAILEIPELDDPSRPSPRILPGIQEEFELTLKNPGGEMLRIENLSVRSEKKDVILRHRFEPIAIEPGEERKLRLEAVCKGRPTVRPHYFQLHFQSNDPATERNLRNLTVDVIDDEFTDYVSVDFGTTDSSVAYLDASSREAVNLLLDGKDAKIYSNIFFMDYDAAKTPPFIWTIGKKAAQLGAGQPRRCLKSIKTDIGRGLKREVQFPDKKDPQSRFHELASEEVAQFIIMDLLRRSQRSLVKRLSRFILCVPTRFTLRRKQILKHVFTQAAEAQGIVLDRLRLVDESLAAGLFYILRRGPKDEMVLGKPNYSLMIVDFGGGTTDITVFQVKQQLMADGRVKGIDHIEILGAWGDASLGGEGVTRRLASILTERFLEQSLKRKPSPEEIQETAFRLEDEAEAAKIAVSELLALQKAGSSLELDHLVNQALGTSLGSNLGYVWDVDRSPTKEQIAQALGPYLASGDLTISSADFPGFKVSLSQQEVVEIYHRRLQRLKGELEVLLKRIGMPQVDVLLLAGQSSLFPTVREVLDELGQKGDFVRDADGNRVLKECVSLGALFYSYCYAGKLSIHLTGHEKYWTRVGWDTFAPGLGALVFEDIIPWGTSYPFESPNFHLNEDNVRAGRLRLELKENLSLDDKLRMAPENFATFALDLNGTTLSQYPCQLRIGEEGEVKAFCLLQDEWIEMERID